MRLLSRDQILAALEALAVELEKTGSSTDVVIGGGAALVLLYNARDATRDVDAFALLSANPESLRVAVRKVAELLDLPEDWLNNGAKGYLHGLALGDVLLERPFLIVRTVTPQQLLAMKLCAWRDDVDIADARLLLSKIPGDKDRIWDTIQSYLIPGRELKARYAYEDLWELEHGSS
ncbi:MAG TPA: DUF6036 family nucleotidyltransferase [Thermoanaerobaculia bacterium]|nr:DUF6036 family nucleotidyltransferase [Thermoanaerobaculia bacterium]